MSGISGIGGNMTVQQVTGGLDLEAFMMTVQAERANNLEAQLAMQVEEVKQRQDEIAKLTQLLAELRALRPGGNDSGKYGALGSTPADSEAMVKRLEEAGVSILRDRDDSVTGATNRKDANDKYDAKQVYFDKWIEELKGKIDSLNSTSQLDMIRLQSLSNKRNEAFDQLSNIMQKLSKARETAIGNMR